MSVRNLESLFHPRSVAVIGASDRAGSVGGEVWRNLRQGGFQGALWAVNQRAHMIGDVAVLDSVAALPQAPELAVICTPAAGVPQLIDELGARGTRAAIVLSAGLREQAEDGRGTLEQAMLDAARPHLLRILGPNCIGLLVPGLGLNASFAPGQALPGQIAFVTQSGALATAMLDWANSREIGFSHFISLGDSADVDFGDVLDYLASDGGTRAILMYVESVKHARKFMSAARAAARNKPVILVKAGRAPDGARAAASHTGAMAGSDTVFDAAVRRAGMLRVNTLESLFDAAETLAHPQPWRGDRLALLTNGGGAGVLAADALAQERGRLAVLSPETLQALDAVLPAQWPRGNPVDIIGDAPAARYRQALDVLLAAPEVDAVLFMHAPTTIVPAAEIAAACVDVVEHAAKPVVSCWLGAGAVAAARQNFTRHGIASHSTPERAVAAWMQWVHYNANQQALLELPEAQPTDFVPDRLAAQAVLDDAVRGGREWLDEAQAKRLLRAYGIATVATTTARDAEEAVEAAARIGYPVALKIVSPQIVHKSDVGGVMLNLSSAEDVRRACIEMRMRVARLSPQAHVFGFTVQAMARRPGAHELIVGIATDEVFGPVVLFGEGGVAVELRHDRAVALPPLNAALARDLIARTQVGPLLAGYRGRAAANEPALLDALLKVSQMACDLAAVAELDINPLLADADGVLALDARVRLRRPQPGEASRLALRPYPRELEATALLGEETLLLRPIRPDDGARLAEFYRAASPADLRLRFFMARREVPRSELARYCQIDYEREMTFVAIAGDRMAGEVRAVCDPDNRRAEFAIQVAGPWQNRGLGRLLLDRMVRYLRARGTGEIVGSCLQENTGMVSLARHAGFEIATADEDTMRLSLDLRAGRAVPAA
jgi:acetyltransferase